MPIVLAVAAIIQSLAPAGKWTIDYGKNMCVLSRDFGTIEPVITVGFFHQPFSDDWTFILKRRGGAVDAGYGRADLTFNPGNYRASGLARRWQTADGYAMTMIDMHGADSREIEKAASIKIDIDNDAGKWLLLDRFSAGLKAMSACNDDLSASWHLDIGEQKLVKERAKEITPGDFLTAEDYPDDALRLGQQGRAVVAFAISPEGRVADCRTLVSSGFASLDAATCTALQAHSRYRPALGQDDKPMVSHQTRTVNWIIPRP